MFMERGVEEVVMVYFKHNYEIFLENPRKTIKNPTPDRRSLLEVRNRYFPTRSLHVTPVLICLLHRKCDTGYLINKTTVINKFVTVLFMLETALRHDTERSRYVPDESTAYSYAETEGIEPVPLNRAESQCVNGNAQLFRY
jgi:hypothetical protein